ncbi:hypothetical protein J5Y04_25655 [Kitasatospora sp. RG8]|uniref:hypothetical protein n=1 Tax=Kitasatospora sp. RG8 TaxID=2820815 RepID=UPI001ADF1E0D|nr:hypothetical protein [Kitasatospora sp. RG8]MBP0452904.1 hypothetical protein [Kitasatospora sp. RG8]
MTTPNPGTLQIDNTTIKNVLHTVETHMSSMKAAGANVEAINTEIHEHFQAACSSVFVQKMKEWHEEYVQLSREYDRFHADLLAGSGTVFAGHDSAYNVAGQVGGGYSAMVESGLNPKAH